MSDDCQIRGKTPLESRQICLLLGLINSYQIKINENNPKIDLIARVGFMMSYQLCN